MRKLKKVVALSLALAMGASLVACGGTTEPAADTEATTEAAASEDTEEAAPADEDAAKAEALLPVAASDIIAHNKGIIKFFNSSETWFGMTYPEDRQLVKDEIAKKIKDGYYPEQLWAR